MLFRRIGQLGVVSLVSFVFSSSLAAATTEAVEALNRAEHFVLLRNWTAAEPFYATAEQQFSAAGDEENAMFARISRLRGQLPQIPLLKASHQLAALLENAIVLRNPRLRLRCLAVKGDVDLDLDPDFALRDWTEAQSIANQLGDKIWANRAKGELAIIAFLSGSPFQAGQEMTGALKTAGKLGDLGSVVRYEALMGDGMVQWKKYSQALTLFNQALSVAQRNTDMQDPLLVYSGKVDALIGLGRIGDAKSLLDTALHVAQAKAAVGYQAELRLKYASVDIGKGDRQDALHQLEQALLLAKRAQGSRIEAEATFMLAQVQLSEGQLKSASTSIAQSIEKSREMDDRVLLPASLAEAGRIQAARGNFRAADSFFEQGTDIADGVIAHVRSVMGTAEFIASIDDLYADHIRLHADHFRNAAGTFTAMESIRARSITDSLTATPLAGVPRPARLTDVEKRIADLQLALLQTRSKNIRRRLLADLDEAEAERGPEVDIRGRILLHANPVRLAQMRRILKPNEAVLEYFTSASSAYCLIISRRKATLARLPGQKVSKLIQRHLASIASNANIIPTGKELYHVLLPQAARLFSNLIIVPDRLLYRLPFDTLADDQGQMLMRSRTIWYAPSATVLYLIRTRPQDRNLRPLLAVASGPANTESPVPALRGDLSHVEARSFPELKAATWEVRSIGKIAGSGAEIVTGANASETALKNEPLDRFRILHFAVHALSDPKVPSRSGLVFAPDKKAGEDGIWQPREILQHRFNAELITLSACDTAKGKNLGAGGNMSLVNPFLAAGSRAVLASLWDSNDLVTRALMKEFYAKLYAGAPAADALRQAKLRLIERYGDQAAPALWAGFVLTGENVQINR
jgi:CHAT domain-containing protein/tetratricopeptide (TPR) repeat protein